VGTSAGAACLSGVLRVLLTVAAMLLVACSRDRPVQLQACGLRRSADESDACFAVRCAEDFVVRNGYTAAPPAGPLQPESLEWSPDIAQARRGTLQPGPVGHKFAMDRHWVAFAHRTRSDTRRVVSMTSAFAELQMHHQDALPSATEGMPRCK
jgi:hypothetical protein